MQSDDGTESVEEKKNIFFLFSPFQVRAQIFAGVKSGYARLDAQGEQRAVSSSLNKVSHFPGPDFCLQ